MRVTTVKATKRPGCSVVTVEVDDGNAWEALLELSAELMFESTTAEGVTLYSKAWLLQRLLETELTARGHS